jgi:hypothetical protein
MGSPLDLQSLLVSPRVIEDLTDWSTPPSNEVAEASKEPAEVIPLPLTSFGRQEIGRLSQGNIAVDVPNFSVPTTQAELQLKKVELALQGFASVKLGGSPAEGLTEKQLKAMLLHSLGYDSLSVCKYVPCSLSELEDLLQLDTAKRLVERREALLDSEFKALYGLSIDTLRDCMSSEDERVRLYAVDKWFKAAGKYSQILKHEILTAEDVAKRLIEESKRDRELAEYEGDRFGQVIETLDDTDD